MPRPPLSLPLSHADVTSVPLDPKIVQWCAFPLPDDEELFLDALDGSQGRDFTCWSSGWQSLRLLMMTTTWTPRAFSISPSPTIRGLRFTDFGCGKSKLTMLDVVRRSPLQECMGRRRARKNCVSCRCVGHG
ncbi:hypothetical protein B0H13DRAFT_2372780 [Mycena leptocephala]|nr:hypothetical protein B0H13DRAFT_2372780 [Mycena leptocephala]